MVKTESGFTILEIIIATTLLAVVGSTILAAFTNSAVLTKGQDHVAYNLARQKLENLYESVRGDWWDISSKPLSLTAPDEDLAAVKLDGRSYLAVYKVNNASGVPIDINGDGNEDYRKVEMTVQWT